MLLRSMYLTIFAAALVAWFRCTSATPIELTVREVTPSASKIQADLGPKLCKGASIYFPSSPEFGEYTERWSTEAEGDILVVVAPGCRKDIATVVRRSLMSMMQQVIDSQAG